MGVSRLPDKTDRLVKLQEICSHVYGESKSAAAILREMEKKPKPSMPVVVSQLLGVSVCTQYLTREGQVNQLLRAITNVAKPLLRYLELSDSDKEHIATKFSALLFPEPIEYEDWTILAEHPHPKCAATVLADPVKVKLLVDFLDRMVRDTSSLQARIDKKLKPPSVSDRVRVDLVKGIVEVDGKPFPVLDRQAILFHYLARANGEPVSGPEIARQEKIKEFRSARIKDQIKHKALTALLKISQRGKRGFYLQLPPLEQ